MKTIVINISDDMAKTSNTIKCVDCDNDLDGYISVWRHPNSDNPNGNVCKQCEQDLLNRIAKYNEIQKGK